MNLSIQKLNARQILPNFLFLINFETLKNCLWMRRTIFYSTWTVH